MAHVPRKFSLLTTSIGCAAAMCNAPFGVAAGGLPNPSRQDIQIIGRVLSFRDASSSGSQSIAIVYNGADPQSQSEANAIAELLGGGFSIGDLTLRPVLVEQGRLLGTSGHAAIVTTASVSGALVRSALAQQRVPCITRHTEQVTQGPCIVSIRSNPSVSIAYSSANAAAAGVRFATAFIMMVREV